MKRILAIVFLMGVLTACASAPDLTETDPAVPVDASPAPTQPVVDSVQPVVTDSVAVTTLPAQADDFFTQMGIVLPVPTCNGLTQSQTDGPYYTPNTPERNSLLEEGMTGTRLILVGYVLDQDCQPLANAWLDFWQADANGEYDNSGYRLRGHQFTDAQGHYFLETVVPGEYPGRTEHIHVKVKPEGGEVVTSQLYFPDVPANQQDGIFDPSLIVQIEDKGDYLLAYFNFVVQKQGKGDY
jgi:protocatechuate 3,4-dioxygenase beta subunit